MVASSAMNGLAKALSSAGQFCEDHPFLAAGAATLVFMKARRGFSNYKNRVKNNTILEIDLTTRFLDPLPHGDLVAKLKWGKFWTIHDLISTLERSAKDDKVVGLVAKVGKNPSLSLARMGDMQEVRAAILNFKKTSKKPTFCYADTFGEFDMGTEVYWLASAFDQVYMSAAGFLNITGLRARSPFLRSLLEKLDVEPLLDHRKEYKNYKNFFAEKKYTEAHREATEALIKAMKDQLIQDISGSRGLPVAKVEELIEKAPHDGSSALQEKLLDGIKFYDEVLDQAKGRIAEDKGTKKEKVNLLFLREYKKKIASSSSPSSSKSWAKKLRFWEQQKEIALITMIGGVATGKSSFDAYKGEWSTLGSDTFCAAIKAANKDPKISAIIVRVDSPGGSAVASELMAHEMARSEKPVVVSMANVAGSGGYYMALNAKKIVANPLTITGSIGVIAGKFQMRRLFERLGITFDEVHTAENDSFFSYTDGYGEKDKEILDKFLDDVYKLFTERVAEGRKIPIETVQDIAKGRIYPGSMAKELGLVDSLGGLVTAHGEAAALLGKERDETKLVAFPRSRGLLASLTSKPAQNSEDPQLASASAQTDFIPGELSTLLRVLNVIGRTTGLSSLSSPSLSVKSEVPQLTE